MDTLIFITWQILCPTYNLNSLLLPLFLFRNPRRFQFHPDPPSLPSCQPEIKLCLFWLPEKIQFSFTWWHLFGRRITLQRLRLSISHPTPCVSAPSHSFCQCQKLSLPKWVSSTIDSPLESSVHYISSLILSSYNLGRSNNSLPRQRKRKLYSPQLRLLLTSKQFNQLSCIGIQMIIGPMLLEHKPRPHVPLQLHIYSTTNNWNF